MNGISIKGHLGAVTDDLIIDMKVGIPELDNEHLKIVEILARLESALDEREEAINNVFFVEDILCELKMYVKNHFELEDDLMQRYNYPEMHDHKAEHDFCWKKVEMFGKHFSNSSDELGKMILYFVRGWIGTHLLSTDSKLGAFLREVQGKENVAK